VFTHKRAPAGSISRNYLEGGPGRCGLKCPFREIIQEEMLMPNDFIGELSKSSLFELVGPLLHGKKSGMIRIKGDHEAELYLEAGKIVHALTDLSVGEEAILNLMEWHAGRVTFDWEASTDERTVSMTTEQMLQSRTNREEEWARIRELIPSSSITFKMSLDGPQEDRQIQGNQWKVLTMCNGDRTVLDIAGALKWDEFRVSKILYGMVMAGLISKAGQKVPQPKVEIKRYVNGNFFPLLEIELKRIMGPIASIIIDDVISDLGQTRESFREELVRPFLQSLAEEISDDVKRASFSTTMAELVAQKLR
jgi:hypothetical protein